MPAVWTPRHAGHAPGGGYWLGVELPGDEEPPRGEVLRAGARSRRRRRPPRDQSRRRAAAARPRCRVPRLVLAGVERVGSRGARRRDRAAARRAVRVRAPPAHVRPSDPRAGGAVGAQRPIRDGHHDAHRARHLRRGARRGRHRAHRLRPRAGPGSAGRVRRDAVRRDITRARRSTAAPATSTTRRSPRSTCATAARARVAIIDIDAHHGNGTQEIFYARDDVFFGSVHVDPGAGLVPPLPGLRRRARRRRGHRLQPQPARSRREPATTTGSTAVQDLVEEARRFAPDALVVSLGVDAAEADPESPLKVTETGFTRAGRALGDPRRAHGVRPGRRLRPRPARRARHRGAPRVREPDPHLGSPAWNDRSTSSRARTSTRGLPNPGRPHLQPPPHWRLEAIAAVERPRDLVVTPDGGIVFILDRDSSDVWHLAPGATQPDAASRPSAAWRRTGRTPRPSSPPTVRRPRSATAATSGSTPVDGSAPPRRVVRAGAPEWLDDHRLLGVVGREGNSHLVVFDLENPWPQSIAHGDGDCGFAVGVAGPTGTWRTRSGPTATATGPRSASSTSRAAARASSPARRSCRTRRRRGHPTARPSPTSPSAAAGTRSTSSTRAPERTVSSREGERGLRPARVAPRRDAPARDPHPARSHRPRDDRRDVRRGHRARDRRCLVVPALAARRPRSRDLRGSRDGTAHRTHRDHGRRRAHRAVRADARGRRSRRRTSSRKR